MWKVIMKHMGAVITLMNTIKVFSLYISYVLGKFLGPMYVESDDRAQLTQLTHHLFCSIVTNTQMTRINLHTRERGVNVTGT